MFRGTPFWSVPHAESLPLYTSSHSTHDICASTRLSMGLSVKETVMWKRTQVFWAEFVACLPCHSSGSIKIVFPDTHSCLHFTVACGPARSSQHGGASQAECPEIAFLIEASVLISKPDSMSFPGQTLWSTFCDRIRISPRSSDCKKKFQNTQIFWETLMTYWYPDDMLPESIS